MIKKSLAISEVIQILENANEDQCISAPPSKPKASQVYLYKVDDAAKQGTLLYNIYTCYEIQSSLSVNSH